MGTHQLPPGSPRRTTRPRGDPNPAPGNDEHNAGDVLLAYYEAGGERSRLDSALGQVEWERTTEVLLRYLPPTPAVIADIGGGPGRYALWLAGLVYHVQHRDLVPLHVRQLQEGAGAILQISSRVADARQLDLADDSVDAALLLGPLYHLAHRSERLQALAEAWRIVRPGGVLAVAAISRWAPRLHGQLVNRLYEHFPAIENVARTAERNGTMPPLFPGSFHGYCHRPQQLRREIRAVGFQLVSLVAVEGLAFALSDLEQRMADPAARRVVLDSARAIERVPELMGLAPHMLAVARRPPRAGPRHGMTRTEGHPLC